MENGENKLIWPKLSGLKFVEYFSKDGVEEMMRNASCFGNFIPCK